MITSYFQSPVEYMKESFSVTLKGLGGSTLTGCAAAAAAACAGGMLGGGGAGHSSSPALRTIEPRVTSSFKSMLK